MKYLTFLLLLIAVNCNGQILDTTKPLSGYGTYKKRPIIDSLPLMFSSIKNFAPLIATTGYSTFQDFPTVGWNYNSDSADIQINYPFVVLRSRGDILSYMKEDGSWVISDTAETLNLILKFTVRQQKEIDKLIEKQTQYEQRIYKIYKNNYVVDRKKFDKQFSAIQDSAKAIRVNLIKAIYKKP